MRGEIIQAFFNAIQEVASSYFGMITSGDINTILVGIIGLLGISVFAYRLVKRFWYYLFD